MEQWIDEREAWLSAMMDFRPMDSKIIEFLCDDLLGSPIHVDGERLDVYGLLAQIESTLALGAEGEAIIDAFARLDVHIVDREW
jgi:hypothetical protein